MVVHQFSVSGFRHRIDAFVRDESGAIVLFILPIFLLMVLAAGAAIDYMRHETLRAKLQDGLDRGMLAAANLRQTLDTSDQQAANAQAAEVIRQYMRSAGIEEEVALNVVVSPNEQNDREITATASIVMPTSYLNLAGISSLDVRVGGGAREKRVPIEVSLVLDISGSMRESAARTSTEKISLLRPAAENFIKAILTEASVGVTSINLVPYAGQVNIAPLFRHYVPPNRRDHSFSSCIELFEDSELGNTALPSQYLEHAQVPHFMNWRIDSDYMQWGWCPNDDASVVVQSNDADALINRINTMPLHDGTGTHYALKWALALLDPTSNETVKDLAPEEFKDRPLPWPEKSDRDEWYKIVVLMTDGKIVEQARPNSETMSNPGRMRKLATPQNGKGGSSSCGSGSNRRNELECNSGWRTNRRSQAQNSNNFDALCALAEQRKVRVFTIGFDVQGDSNAGLRNQLKNCATFDSDFYNVEGTDIAKAFESIAGQINRLKLVN